MMSWPLERPVLPSDLVESIREGQCVAYIGSGASSGCYGSWRKLVNDLCAQCGSSREVTETSSSDDYLDAAEDAKTRNPDRYHAFLSAHFGKPIELTNPIYHALLSCTFKSYLTTNFDRLLAHQASLPGIPKCNGTVMWYPYDLPIQQIAQRTIYYLHGYVQESVALKDGEIVLSKSEFEKAYQSDHRLKRFLIETISNECMCFVGCELREEPIKRLFAICEEEHIERMNALQQRGGVPKEPPSRYILLRKPEVFGKEQRFDMERSQQDLEDDEKRLKSLGIDVVWYSVDHSHLARTFSDLAGLPQIRLSGLSDGGCEDGN